MTFFAQLAKRTVIPAQAESFSADPLDRISALRPSTIDVAHALNPSTANVAAIYNGWPATYADISAGLTFRRNVADQITKQISEGKSPVAILLGASGVGKTSASRQAVWSLVQEGFFGVSERSAPWLFGT